MSWSVKIISSAASEVTLKSGINFKKSSKRRKMLINTRAGVSVAPLILQTGVSEIRHVRLQT